MTAFFRKTGGSPLFMKNTLALQHLWTWLRIASKHAHASRYIWLESNVIHVNPENILSKLVHVHIVKGEWANSLTMHFEENKILLKMSQPEPKYVCTDLKLSA